MNSCLLRCAALPALLGVSLFAANGEKPRVARAVLAGAQKLVDQQIDRLNARNPALMLVNMTQSVYLEGFGVVFTAEVNLHTVGISPFRPALTPAEVAELRKKKLAMVAEFKRAMKEILAESAATLKPMPEEELVVLGISLINYSWEDDSGLPKQILMQAPRKALLEYRTSKDPALLDAAIRVQEF